MFGLGRLALQPRAECAKWHVWLQRKFCECLEGRDHCQLSHEWCLCCSTLVPLEAAWYGLPPSRVPSVGGSDSGAGLRQLCLPGPRATPPAPAGQSQGGQHQPSPITLSAGMPLPIWAQGPHVTSWQKEPWTGQDREARCQLLAGTRSSQGPRPWLLSDFSFFKIYY